MTPEPKKLAKNKFKCFQCRLIFAQKDGDWFIWDSMQVHLCRDCDKLRVQRSQRGGFLAPV